MSSHTIRYAGASRRPAARRAHLAAATVFFAATLAAHPAAAQEAARTGRSAAGGCPAARVDTVGGMVYVNIDLDGPPTNLGRGLSRQFLDLVLQNVGAGITDTVMLGPMYSAAEVIVPAINGSPTKEVRESIGPAWAGHSALSTEVTFVMQRSGAVSNVRVRTRGDSAVAAMLVRAVTEAGARESRPTIPADVPADAIPFVLRLSLSADHNAAATQPLVPARQIIPEAQPPTSQPKNELPRYPENQRNSGASAVVVAWFDVDERGRVVKGTFGAAPPADPANAGAYRSFVGAVERAANAWRFTPAMSNGCPVRAHTAAVVRFTVQAAAQPSSGGGS